MKRVENEMKAAQKKANDTKKALISLKGKRDAIVQEIANLQRDSDSLKLQARPLKSLW